MSATGMSLNNRILIYSWLLFLCIDPSKSFTITPSSTTTTTAAAATCRLCRFCRRRRSVPLPHSLIIKNSYNHHYRHNSMIFVSASSVSPTRSKMRNPKNNRIAIQWVVESIEKVLRQERSLSKEINKNAQGEGTSRTNTATITSSTNLGCNTIEDDEVLLDALYQIVKGKTKKEIIDAGNKIINLQIEQKFSFSIQERIMKVTAMAGLIQLSCMILNHMVVSQKHLPSSMGYIAVLNGLRKVKQIDILKTTMMNLVSLCQESSKDDNLSLDTFALNTYLGALCESSSSKSDIIVEALDILRSNNAKNKYAIKDGPDTCSYNTVLNAAISTYPKNTNIITEILDLMKSNNIEEDIYTYNLRLKACDNSKMGTEDKIVIINEVLSHPKLTPDKFTIEQMLVPLAKNGRVGDILDLLKVFNAQKQSDMSLSNAYSTFLIALTKGGEIDIAREIFSANILHLPTKQKQINKGAINFISDIQQVQPITRHFNVLIEGYRNLFENEIESSLSDNDNNHNNKRLSPQEHAAILYNSMIASGVYPDAYTYTSLIGLQTHSEAITKLWQDADSNLGSYMTTPVYHSIITAYGRLNDPSSACFTFSYMMENNLLRSNSWNVLLSSLSKVSKKCNNKRIQCFDSSACSQFEGNSNCEQSHKILPGDKTFAEVVDGKYPIDAALEILDVMKASSAIGDSYNFVPRPTSQSFCLVASILSHKSSSNGEAAIQLYNDAMQANTPADGRFINALIRCFSDDIDGALRAWKTLFRPSVLKYENRDRPKHARHKKGKNLVAAYHGLVHVSGRAGRPDLALRLAYAMKKEGFEPNETTLNSYKTGAVKNRMEKSIRLNNQYENLLAIECLKYDTRDKRRLTEKRVRIII